MNRHFLKAGCILMALLLLLLSSASPVSAKTEEESVTTLTKELVSLHKNTYPNLTDQGDSATLVTETYSGMFLRDGSIVTQVYYAQTESDRALYRLNAPNNKAAQPFAVPYSSITGVRLNLGKTNDTDQVTVRILTDYRDDATVIGTASYTFGENPSGWQTVLFDQPVSVTPKRMYYLVVSATEDSGNVVWNGISAASDFHSINYDLKADGGWRSTGDITAFEILSDEEDDSLSGVYAQKNADKALYLLNAPNHKAVQPFTAPFTRIDSVMAYLTCTEDTDRALVRIMQDYRDDATVVAQQEFGIGGTKDGWQRLVFDAPVEIEAGKRYYLEISAPEGCGNVVWKGSEAIDGYQAINYDPAAYSDGYQTDSKTTAFAIVPYVSLSEQPAACRFIFADSGSLIGAQVSLRTAEAGGSLCVELRSTADGPAIATTEAETLLAGENTYTLSFDQPATIAADQIYYLTILVTGAPGETVLMPGDNGADSGDCYVYNGEAWRPVAAGFGIEPVAGADYTAVDAALEKIDGLKESNYTADSWARLQEAKNAVERGLPAGEQETVDGYATAIEAARDALVEKDADYTAVNAAKAKAAGLTEANYTEESWNALQTAIGAVVEGKKITEQLEVDGYAAAIEDAITALVPKSVDMTLTISKGMVTEAETTGKYNITWNAKVVLGDDLTIADINKSGIQFKNYGVYYATGADVLDNYKNASADQIRKIAFAEGEDVVVYTAYGFRVKNVTAEKTRAAMFYIEYELDGQSYILLSTVDEVIAVVSE